MSRLVLVLDDSLTIRMNLKEVFEAAKFSVRPCATAVEARQILSHEKVGLIILDVQLPDVDGIEFLKELKSRDATKKIPVIVLSSEVEIMDRVRGISGGADEYVGKPYDASYLIAKAQELLRDQNKIETPRSKHLILIVDDSSTYREALKESLTKKGYDVEMAETGEASRSR